MDQRQWNSPQQGYQSPSGWQNPRFRGGRGYNTNSPGRFFSPRSHNNFRPYNDNFRNSSPYEQQNYSPQYRQPFHQQGRGSFRHSSPKFFHDQSFSPREGRGRNRQHGSRDDIQSWVHPAMWGDPWAELRSDSSPVVEEALPEQEGLDATFETDTSSVVYSNSSVSMSTNDAEIPLEDDEDE